MFAKPVYSMVVFAVTLSFASAAEFNAYIINADDGAITYQKYKLGKGSKESLRDGSPVMIPVAKDAKIAYYMFDKIDRKVVVTGAIEGGLKGDLFQIANGSIGFPARITTDAEDKTVTQILVRGTKRPGVVPAVEPDGFKPLFNGKDMTGWKTFLKKDDKYDPAKTIVVKDGEIQVNGFPYGYFYTEKAFKNYVIRYSWTYPKDQPEKTTMNSGLLIHIQEPHKVWPKCIEPQGRYMDHGKLFFMGFDKDAKKESTFDDKSQKKALKASHEWNTTEATVRGDGSLEVRINGVVVSTGKSELTSGMIGFQSEGARIHFKDIKIKMLD